MKKFIFNSQVIFFYGLLVLMLYSCGKDDSITPEEPKQEKFTQKNNCIADLNDMEVNLVWDTNCHGKVTISLCCECTSDGPYTGCTLEQGTLEIQTEEAPYVFHYYELNIPHFSIAGGTCYEMEFELDSEDIEAAFVSQLWFTGRWVNEEPLNFEWDNNQAYCPYY